MKEASVEKAPWFYFWKDRHSWKQRERDIKSPGQGVTVDAEMCLRAVAVDSIHETVGAAEDE